MFRDRRTSNNSASGTGISTPRRMSVLPSESAPMLRRSTLHQTSIPRQVFGTSSSSLSSQNPAENVSVQHPIKTVAISQQAHQSSQLTPASAESAFRKMSLFFSVDSSRTRELISKALEDPSRADYHRLAENNEQLYAEWK
ncbi:unnamed protein product, partial [Protopolystoma xenopodis]